MDPPNLPNDNRMEGLLQLGTALSSEVIIVIEEMETVNNKIRQNQIRQSYGEINIFTTSNYFLNLAIHIATVTALKEYHVNRYER